MLSSNNGLHEGDFVELFSNNPYEPTKEETMRAFDQKYGSHPSGHVTMWIEEVEQTRINYRYYKGVEPNPKKEAIFSNY